MSTISEIIKTLANLSGWRMTFLTVTILVAGFFFHYDALVSKFAIDFVKKTHTHQLNVEEALSESRIINNALEDMLKSGAADRAYIFLFHNGEYWYTGKSKTRLSCTFERVARGISPQAGNLQGLPISLYQPFIDVVADTGMIYEDINKIEDYSMVEILRIQGIKSIILKPIYHDNLLIGLIGLDYVTRPPSLQEIAEKNDMPIDTPYDVLINIFNKKIELLTPVIWDYIDSNV